MKKMLNNKGMALSAVLGIVIFVLTSTVILMTFSYKQYLLIESNHQNNQEYINAKQEIDAACKIIIRDEDFGATYLLDLSNYLDVDITEYSDTILQISKTTTYNKIVTSYLSHSSSSAEIISTVDSLFDFDGLESTFDINEVNPFLTPISILSSYLSVFMDNKFPSLNYDETFNDFDDLFKYIKDLTKTGTTYIEVSAKSIEDQKNPTVTGNWYVDDDLSISNGDDLTIGDGYVLFVKGKLTMGKDSTIYGTVITNDDILINSKNNMGSIKGTIYTSGKVTAGKYLTLGTDTRPTFIFSEKEIIFNKTVSGYGYFLSEAFEVDNRGTSISIYGGVYSDNISNLGTNEITANQLDGNDLYSFGVPVGVPLTSGSTTTPSYLYTNPK